jgi:pyruvate/2-oxoglutarate dehydrogenase complex dihydrolipoamide acyltransferase (E2) component
VVRLSRERLLVLDLLSLAAGQRTVHGLVEVDITTVRRRRAGAVGPPTLTAFLIAALGRAVARHPELNARRAGRRLVLFDDVDVAVSVERELGSGRLPLPHVVRRASERSAAEIGAELAEVRRVPVSGAGDLTGHPWVARTPAVVRRIGARALGRLPAAAARFGPPIGLSSLGMFGAGWGIPLSPMTLMVTVGGSSRRLVPIEGRAEERDVLPLTLSFDHTVVDGAPAARFAETFRRLIEDAALLVEQAGEQPGTRSRA